MWVFNVEDLLNAFLQNWHLCGLSAVWMILCLHNVLDKRNPLPHMLHTKGLVFVWSGIRKCMVSVYFVLNTLWHCKHWYFGSIPRLSISDKLPIVEVDSVGLGTLSFLPEKLITFELLNNQPLPGVSNLKVLLASLSSSNWAAASKVSMLLDQSSLGLWGCDTLCVAGSSEDFREYTWSAKNVFSFGGWPGIKSYLIR